MSEQFFEKLVKSGRLPTPPGVVVRLLEISRDPQASATEVADAVAMDSRLAAKILRFVNSPLAGIGREVTSLRDAVSLIGLRAVKMMALSLSIISGSRNNGCDGFNADLFAVHSTACGVAARAIAEHAKYYAPQEAFLAGLLSQMGRSTLANSFPDQYAQVLQQAKKTDSDTAEWEQRAFGMHYAAIGAKLLRSWDIPELICEAIERFRDDALPTNENVLATIIATAEATASFICPDETRKTVRRKELAETLSQQFAMSKSEFSEFIETVLERTEDMREMLDLAKGPMLSSDELQDQITERVTELSVALHLENRTLAQRQEELMQRATTDALTGIGNRAAFDARLSLELERAARSGEAIALLMLDVDRFKSFNDVFGHQAGDRVLQCVARALDANTRRVDYLARYGGEEFAIVAPCETVEGIRLLGERLRNAVSELLVSWENEKLSVTISVGAALLTKTVGEIDAPQLIKLADDRLYAAKCDGRDCLKVTVKNTTTNTQTGIPTA